MTSSLVSMVGAAEAAGGEELPWPPLVYGLVAFGFFMAMLALLWSFRNTAAQIGKPKARRPHDDDKTAH